jgi:hypothetical protein
LTAAPKLSLAAFDTQDLGELPMQQNIKTGEVTTSIEELAIYHMLLSKATYEILADKGILDRAKVTERIKKLKSGTKLNIPRPN